MLGAREKQMGPDHVAVVGHRPQHLGLSELCQFHTGLCPKECWWEIRFLWLCFWEPILTSTPVSTPTSRSYLMSHLRVRAELQLAAEEGDKNSVNRQSWGEPQLSATPEEQNELGKASCCLMSYKKHMSYEIAWEYVYFQMCLVRGKHVTLSLPIIVMEAHPNNAIDDQRR
jgi:hypothetical protein